MDAIHQAKWKLYSFMVRSKEPEYIALKTPDDTKYHAFIIHCAIGGNGYVGVTQNHPLYGKHYDDLQGFKVHGGITYSQMGDPEKRKMERADFWYAMHHANVDDMIANRSYGELVTQDFLRHETEGLLNEIISHEV